MTKLDEQPAGDRLEQRSRELFDASVAGLDAHTRSRLNQARQAALDATRGDVSASPMRWLLPVGSAAALGLAAVTAVHFMRADNAAPIVEQANVVGGAVDDLEIIASSEELEMLKDVDFYAWLETQPESLLDDTGEAG